MDPPTALFPHLDSLYWVTCGRPSSMAPDKLHSVGLPGLAGGPDLGFGFL